jgi:hypothetical protein
VVLARPADRVDRPDFPPADTRLPADTLVKRSGGSANGDRGSGRLVPVDHLAAVRDRLRAIVGELASPNLLEETERATGLGSRSASPRVYLVGSVSDTPGSGLLVDLAFLARRLLHDQKLSVEHVVGMLAVPTPSATGDIPASARRALEELQHHDLSNTTYETQLGPNDETVADPGRPFRWCALLDPATAPTLAAHVLFADAFTPVGQTLRPDRSPAPETPYSVVGLRRVLWPRDRLLAAVAARLARDTLAGWTGPADAGMTTMVAKAVEREWTEGRLDVNLVRTGIEFGAAQQLGASMDALIHEILPSPPGASPASGPDMYAAGTALDRLTELLGAPGANESETNGRATAALTARAVEVGTAADMRLVSLVVSLVEKPGLRVSAAHEAIRLLGERLTAGLAAVEREAAGLEDESRAGFAGLRDLLVGPVLSAKSVTRKPNVPSDFSTRAAQWAKTRYRQLCGRAAADVYRRLLTTIPQLERELGLVTTGLTALTRELSAATEAVLPADEVCEYLLPFGAGSFEEAVDKLAGGFGEGTRREFDDLVQSKLRKAGRGIIQVAVRLEDSGPRLVRVLRGEAERFVNERANRLSAAQALVKHFPDRSELQEYLGRVFELAAPAARPSGGACRTVLGIPSDPAGLQLGDVLRKVSTDSQVLEARLDDELFIHREWHGISLADFLGRPGGAGDGSPVAGPPRHADESVMI